MLLSNQFYLTTFGALEWDPEGFASDLQEESIYTFGNEILEEEDIGFKEDAKEEAGSSPRASPEQASKPDEEQGSVHSVTKVKPSLNYREFLTEKVKFKKVVEFKEHL